MSMSTPVSTRMLLRDTILLKWIIALIVPVSVFTFVWSGDIIINKVLLGLFLGRGTSDIGSYIQAAVFVIVIFATVIALTGYLVAADSGRRSIADLWFDILFFAVIPLLLVYSTGLIFGLALSIVVWAIYIYVRNVVHLFLSGGYVRPELERLRFFSDTSFGHVIWPVALPFWAAFFYLRDLSRQAKLYAPTSTLPDLAMLNVEQRTALKSRAIAGSFWFATLFALIWLIVDGIYLITGNLASDTKTTILLLGWAVIRTALLIVGGYFLGRLAGRVALRRTLVAKASSAEIEGGSVNGGRVSLRRRLAVLSTARQREEAKDLVPNDLPLRSSGAQRFYLLFLMAFVLLYPVIDPYLFGSGTDGRLANYGDMGYYVILALGLNIVVGFAGLLDLGYVAFFAIGSYVWGMIGSNQFNVLTGVIVNPDVWPYFFWPMLIIGALIAAFWGVVLGAPTLRLRGDYLAIVTLGFGEIVPIFFKELDRYTNGTNGLVGIFSPGIPGVNWSGITFGPYYYLILALIALCIFANLRLRDSRLGRAWVAIREDEIAASSSGINLVNTKLFAFGAGAFFSGIAGAYHAAKLGTVTPDQFNFSDSVIYLAMVVIGGLGSIPGVIVGAIAVYSISQLILAQLDTTFASLDPSSFLYPLHTFSFENIRNLIFGIILVIIMIFRPEGLIPSARRRRELRTVNNDEEVDVGPLDIQPGAPGFEAEVHVE